MHLFAAFPDMEDFNVALMITYIIILVCIHPGAAAIAAHVCKYVHTEASLAPTTTQLDKTATAFIKHISTTEQAETESIGYFKNLGEDCPQRKRWQ